MKKYFSKIFIALIIIAWIFTYIMGNSFAALDEDNPPPPNESAISTGMLKNIMMVKLSGKDRIHLVVSKQPVIDVKSKDNGNYIIRLEDFEVAESLCRPLGEGELNNIISVVPSQQVIDGKKWVYLTIYPHESVPYSIRKEGENVLIDFNIASIEARNANVASSSRKSVAKVSTGQEKNDVSDQAVKKAPAKKPTEKIVSLDFQDADIKSVFRLMAEYGNVSIITTDEVKGNITLTMKNVPWTKALETILDINALTKKEDDNVIIISSLARSQKDEAAREAQQELEKKRRADKGLLKQVLIEAKIVEASEEFVRNLGIKWGFGNEQRVSGSSQYGLGITGGSNTSQSRTWEQYYPPSLGTGTFGGVSDIPMAAVNLPSSLASPTIGLVFGGATGFLETQLAALETNSTGKIISAPKVVTMEGMKALIKQGDEVPYITPSSGTSPATVTFKEALLKLEVTPKLTDDGKISMDIKASNDTPDWSKAALNPQGNPPIVKSEVESKVVINDGDTVVIGGILRSQDSKAVSGWPWLQKIPVLGWLFKTSDVTKTKRQLLIFVTPRVLNNYDTGENQSYTTNK